jgi:tetratricopeptide (TPR) repeat protein
MYVPRRGTSDLCPVEPAHSSRPTPVFGRQGELRALRLALDGTERGHGGLVVLAGEAGIGKTRLAEQACAEATERGFASAWGSGWPEGGAPPLWPWQEILEQLGATATVGLLGAPERSEPADAERFGRFRAVTSVLGKVSACTPLLVVLDDAHEVDVAALLLSRFVVRSLRSARVLVIVAHRGGRGDVPGAESNLLDSALADLSREGTPLDLVGLTEDGVGEMLAALGRSPEAVIVASLLELTGGNPLLLNEALAQTDARRGVLPGRVRQLLRGRLAGYSEAERAVLAATALLGPGTEPDLVARVVGSGVEIVRAAQWRALEGGLLRVPVAAASGVEFVHGLFREALLADVGAEAVANLQARAADVLSSLTTPASSERLSLIAHYRLGAARDRGDGGAASAAVEACQLAARADMQRLASESAADLLSSACRLLEKRSETVPARLRMELATAELAGGRLRAARAAFRQAIEGTLAAADETEGSTEVLAESALGLGGIWVLEHRLHDEIAWYHGLLRRTAEQLGERRPDLRARIAVRLAAERVYTAQASVAEVRSAVEIVRKDGDARAVAESLSLLHHTMLGPEFAQERLQLAEELVEVASFAGDAVLTLMGVLWRTVDLFLLGDRRAENALAELRQRADALRVLAVLYIVDLIDVMLLLRSGRVREAELAAERCFELGVEVGDADALAYHGAALLAIGWLQGRTADLVPLASEVAASPTLVAGDDVYRAALAALAADAGPPYLGVAQRELDRFAQHSHGSASAVAALPATSNTLVTLFALVEAAARLGHEEVAAAAYEALLPHARLPVMASIAIVCFGPVERLLGLAARTMGRLDLAADHLRRAVDDACQLGNRPLVALARADLGLTLLTRSRGGDRLEGERLLGESLRELRSLGLDGRAATIEEDARRVGEPARSSRTIRFVGGVWEVAGGGEWAIVPDSRGVRHLALLLERPGHDIPATDLVGNGIDSGRQTVLDGTALAAYRRRCDELRNEIDKADTEADRERAARLRQELDELVHHIRAHAGLGGRAREFPNSTERARTAVQKALRRALGRIRLSAPMLADELERGLHTGHLCRYEPDGVGSGEWNVSSPAGDTTGNA